MTVAGLSSLASYFTLDAAHGVGAVSVFCVVLVLVVLGAVLFGPRRLASADLFVGWGAAVLVYVLAGAVAGLPLSAVGVAVAGLAFAGLGWRGAALAGTLADGPVVWRVLVLALPLMVLAAAMSLSQWDEFSQWVPNAVYLLRFDSFPRADLPLSPSVFPAYPHGLALVVHGASKLAGGLVESAGGLFNIVLLVMVAPAYLAVVRRGLGAPPEWMRGWRAAALGVLGVTALTGTFVQKLVFTHYSDAPTAAVLAMAGYLLWRVLNALAGDDDDGAAKATTVAWQAGFVLAAFLFLKQTNLILMALLLGGWALAGLRDPAIRLRALAGVLPAILIPGVVLYLGWRYHVTGNIEAGEFSFLPRDRWMTAEAFTILAKMVEVASKKAPYFIAMTAVSAVALSALWRFRGAYSRLAIMVGALFVGYVVFLWAMYITAFGRYEGLHAASFWRYNTQLGVFGALAVGYGVALLWRRWATARPGIWKAGRGLGIAALVLALAAPVGLAGKVRFDLRPQKLHLRAVSAELGRTLPQASRVLVVDPRGNGIARMILRFELMSGTGVGRDLEVRGDISAFNPNRDAAGMRAFIAGKADLTHLLVHESLPEVGEAFGVTLQANAVTLLERTALGWRVVKAWPYPGYTEPHSLPD